MTASLNFPIYAALALFAEEAVAILLGDQWKDAAFYMRIFAIWGLIRSTGNPSGSLLYAVGMAKRAHIWNMVLSILTFPILWIAANTGGLPTLAWTMLVWQAIIFFLAWKFLIQPACGVDFFSYTSSIAPPFIATFLTVLVGIFFLAVLPKFWGAYVSTSAFFIAYLIFSYLFNRELLYLMREVFTPLLGKKVFR